MYFQEALRRSSDLERSRYSDHRTMLKRGLTRDDFEAQQLERKKRAAAGVSLPTFYVIYETVRGIFP